MVCALARLGLPLACKRAHAHDAHDCALVLQVIESLRAVCDQRQRVFGHAAPRRSRRLRTRACAHATHISAWHASNARTLSACIYMRSIMPCPPGPEVLRNQKLCMRTRCLQGHPPLCAARVSLGPGQERRTRSRRKYSPGYVLTTKQTGGLWPKKGTWQKLRSQTRTDSRPVF